MEKTCPKCGRVLPVENFAKNARLRDGLQCWCRVCHKATRSGRSLTPEQREKERQRKREYRATEKGRQAQREQMRRYRATPKGRAAVRSAAVRYYARNAVTIKMKRKIQLADPVQAQRINDVRRRRRQLNPSYRGRNRIWRKANKELLNSRRRAKYAANPGRYRAQVATQRARRKRAEGFFTGEDVRAAFARQGGCCRYCGVKVGRNAARWEIDHFIPLSRGGTNRPDNIVIACFDCNRAKTNKMPWEFIPETSEVVPM